MLRSRDIPESKSASESDQYSDFEIVCPLWQPRRVCLCVIAAAGACSMWVSVAKCNGTKVAYWLVHCAKRQRTLRRHLLCASPRHEVRLANLLNLSI